MTDTKSETEGEYWGLTDCRPRVEGDLCGSSYTNSFIATQTGIYIFSLNFVLAVYAMPVEMTPTYMGCFSRSTYGYSCS